MRVLQELLVLVFVMSAAAAVAAEPTDESQAIAKLKLLGGEIEARDETLPGVPVTAIRFPIGNRFGDQWLDVLTPFKRMTHLDLSLTATTDVGLRKVAEMKNVRTLCLSGCHVTVGGLKELESRRRDLTIVPTRLVDPAWFRELDLRTKSIVHRARRANDPEFETTELQFDIAEVLSQAVEAQIRINALRVTEVSESGRAMLRSLDERNNNRIATLRTVEEALANLRDPGDAANAISDSFCGE